MVRTVLQRVAFVQLVLHANHRGHLTQLLLRDGIEPEPPAQGLAQPTRLI
jgi:hypothetical protein